MATRILWSEAMNKLLEARQLREWQQDSTLKEQKQGCNSLIAES
jgi:hypothetical protein